MTETHPSDGTIDIRMGLRLPFALFIPAAIFFSWGLLNLIPFLLEYSVAKGLTNCGMGAVMGVVGCFIIKYRRPQVSITEEELQLPGFGIGPIKWCNIVKADSIGLQTRSGHGYLEITLVDKACKPVKKQRRLFQLGEAIWDPQHKTFMINCYMLQWTAKRLAAAINNRTPETSTLGAR